MEKLHTRSAQRIQRAQKPAKKEQWQTQTIVIGLNPGQEYEFTVLASNKESGAKGLPSTGEFKTVEDIGKKCNTTVR